MPLKGSKSLASKQKLLGVFQANKKQVSSMKEKNQEQEVLISEQERLLEEKQKIVDENRLELEKKGKIIDNQRRKLLHKIQKNLNLKQNIDQQEIICKELKERKENKIKVKVTSLTAKKHKGNPTSESLNLRVKVTRRNETLDACVTIHGGTEKNVKPAILGMVDTLTSKVKTKELSQIILNSKMALTASLEKSCLNNWQK